MLLEFENSIKCTVLASCLNNFEILMAEFVFVSNLASCFFCRFLILSAPCNHTLQVEFYAAFIARLIFLMFPIILIVVIALFVLIDC